LLKSKKLWKKFQEAKSIDRDRLIRLSEAYDILCSHTYDQQRVRPGYIKLAKRLGIKNIDTNLIDLKDIVDRKIEYVINYIYEKLKFK